MSVWAGPDDNPWATIPAAAIATEIAPPAPAPDAPGMFRCATPGAVSALYEAAGLRDITEWDVPVTLVTESPEEYWRMITELTAPVVAVLDELDEPARERIGVNVTRAGSEIPAQRRTPPARTRPMRHRHEVPRSNARREPRESDRLVPNEIRREHRTEPIRTAVAGDLIKRARARQLKREMT